MRAQSPSQAVQSLSGGNQQKVALGRLLHQNAEVLLLDEPTRGIDVGSRADVYAIIAQRADAGCAVLVVSSYLPELFGLCDRIAVMCRGRLSPARPVASGRPKASSPRRSVLPRLLRRERPRRRDAHRSPRRNERRDERNAEKRDDDCRESDRILRCHAIELFAYEPRRRE